MKWLMRLLGPVGIVVLALGPGAAVSAAAVAVPDVYESTAIAGGIHGEVSVPAFFEAFGPYSRSEASNGSSHSYHAPMYLGFFLTAAIEQFGFPPLPGTSETLYPQGPTEAGTLETPVDANGFESSGKSTENGASGRSVIARGAFAPVFDLGLGKASSSVLADANGVTAKSSILLEDVELAGGLVSFDQITGSASSRATGVAGESTTDGAIALSGLRVAGLPIDFPVESLPIGALIPLGPITIERLPDQRTISADGTIADIHIGGIRVTVAEPAAEFAFSVTIGDLVARARVVDLPDFEAVAPAGDTPPLVGSTDVEPSTTTRTTPGISAETLITRTVVTKTPVRGGDWIAVAALAALAAPFLLIIRRAFRAAVRP
ncbi:MAG: choice-of-anchor P family protein [Actinomycetota bacterium]